MSGKIRLLISGYTFAASFLVIWVASEALSSGLPPHLSQIVTNAAIMAICALMLMAGISFVVVRGMTHSLRKLTGEILSYGKVTDELHLPLTAKDEVGELARAFMLYIRKARLHEAKLGSVIENVNDALIIISCDGTIDQVNPACCRIFGYEEKELLGKNVSVLMPEQYAKHHHGYVENYKRTRKPKIIGIGREVSGMRKNGDVFPADLSLSEFSYQGKDYFCGIVRDASERHHIERMRDEFVSTVNHELRTPLSSIYGAICILQEQYSSGLNVHGRHLLDVTMDASTRLSRLVDDILDMDKIACGKMPFDMEDHDARALLEDMVYSNEALALRWGVTLRIDPPEADMTVSADAHRLGQAMSNLLSNACKFSPEGGVVHTGVQAKDGKVRFYVRDDGPGIPESFQPRVFERFAQADGTNTRSSGSSGLGLTITKMMVEGMGGEVSFVTSDGRGTTFYIDLPIIAEGDVGKPETMNEAA